MEILELPCIISDSQTVIFPFHPMDSNLELAIFQSCDIMVKDFENNDHWRIKIMKNLTQGNPTKLMLSFALPVCLGNLFQLFYSLADTRIVGSTLGESSLAAVGATTAISTLLIGFLQGLTNGFSIIVSQSFGADKKERLKKAAAGTFLLGFLTTVVLTAVSLLGLNGFLSLLQVPKDLLSEASGYIRIILMGMLITMLYNALAGIMRAVGDTVAPLLFLVCAAFLNVGLDLLFILEFHMGVRGAALATVLAQSVSVVLSFIYMWKRYPIFRLKPEDFKLSRTMVKVLFSSGLSMALMMSLVFFGTLALQCAINTFGTEIIVAHTAARKICEFYFLPISVMGVTMATFCGQNFGAGKFGRVKTGIQQALFITWGWTFVIILLSYTAAPFLIHLVTGSSSPVVVENASRYLRINSLLYFVACGINILRNALQAIGDHITPVISSFIELIGKVLIALFLTPVLQYMGIIIAEPIIWCLMILPLIFKFRRLCRTQNESQRI